MRPLKALDEAVLDRLARLNEMPVNVEFLHQASMALPAIFANRPSGWLFAATDLLSDREKIGWVPAEIHNIFLISCIMAGRLPMSVP
jgi:hypothetical protein